MPMAKKIANLFGPNEQNEVRKELRQMVLNSSYKTVPGYTPASVAYPDGIMPFVDRHMRYLRAHPKLDAWMYLANLRLMTRIAGRQ